MPLLTPPPHLVWGWVLFTYSLDQKYKAVQKKLQEWQLYDYQCSICRPSPGASQSPSFH